MTLDGYNRLETELKRLKTEERPQIIKAIASAREHGDLSENAEYHAARERQAFVEGRVGELEEKIRGAEVIDAKTLTGKEVKFGATVKVTDEDTDEEATYQIVVALPDTHLNVCVGEPRHVRRWGHEEESCGKPGIKE